MTGAWWQLRCPVCDTPEIDLLEIADDGYTGTLTAVDISARCRVGGHHAFTIRVLTVPGHRVQIRALRDEEPASWEAGVS